jgi:hypothetical protein
MKNLIFIFIVFTLIWCNAEKEKIIKWKIENNTIIYKSIELYINDEIKKEKVIEELKKYKDLIKRVDLKIDYELYNSNYLNEILKYYKWENFTFNIEWVKKFNIPYLTEENIKSFEKLEKESYLYYWYDFIINWKEDIEKYSSLKKKNIDLLESRIKNSLIKADTFFLYWYPIRIK